MDLSAFHTKLLSWESLQMLPLLELKPEGSISTFHCPSPVPWAMSVNTVAGLNSRGELVGMLLVWVNIGLQ